MSTGRSPRRPSAETDPDRRAWHRASAAAAPDEDVAAELGRSAARAQARGGLAAAAAFLERAAALTPEPSRRAQRTLAAAQTKFQAGALDDALGLLATAETGVLSDLELARVDLLRAQIAFVATHGSDAPPRLLEAARRLSALDPALARETYLDALSAAMFAGRLAAPGGSALEIAQAARAAPAPAHARRGPDLVLDALATLFSESYEAAVPILRQAEDAFGTDRSATEQMRWMWLATIASVQLWDDAGWEALSERHVRIARKTGALGDLPLALTQRIYLHLLAGELIAAASLAEEIQAATDATGSDLAPYGAVGLAALRGREAEAAYLIERTRTEVTARGEGIGLSVLDWAAAVLYNGLGRYDEACSAALRVAARPQDLNPSMWVMAEVIEAAVRAGTPELAADTHRRLVETTRASGTDWGLGIAARSEALLMDDQRAEDLYVEAIDRLGRCRVAVDLARAHLLYGEWLRRERRRLDARRELRAAHDLFSDLRDGGVRRARPDRAAGDRRACPQADRRHARRTDAAGGPDRALRGERRYEPGDRRSAVHQPEHCRVPPAQGIPQARCEVTHAACAPDVLAGEQSVPAFDFACVRISAKGSRGDRARVVSALDPVQRDRTPFFGSVLPGEVAGVEQRELAVRQALVQILGVCWAAPADRACPR